MCLEIGNTNKCTAKADIVVYKVLVRYPSKNIRTFFRQYRVKIGKTYTSNLVRSHSNLAPLIEEGLHSFNTLKGAKSFARSRMVPSLVIAECIIPKGAKYYVGIFNDWIAVYGSHASNKLKYVKIIEEEEKCA